MFNENKENIIYAKENSIFSSKKDFITYWPMLSDFQRLPDSVSALVPWYRNGMVFLSM